MAYCLSESFKPAVGPQESCGPHCTHIQKFEESIHRLETKFENKLESMYEMLRKLVEQSDRKMTDTGTHTHQRQSAGCILNGSATHVEMESFKDFKEKAIPFDGQRTHPNTINGNQQNGKVAEEKKHNYWEQHGMQKGVKGHKRLPRRFSENGIDCDPRKEKDLDRTLQERKKLRSILSQDDMTKIDKGANIQPLSNDGTDEGLTMTAAPLKRPTISLKEFRRNKLPQEELKELNKRYSHFLKETEEDLPECIVTTHTGNNSKKIVITYQDTKEVAEKFIKDKFPEYWENDYFTFQVANNVPKFVGEIGIITPNNEGTESDYSFGTESCLARDDTNLYVVTLKHIIKNDTGEIKREGNLCFNFAKKFMQGRFSSCLGYYGGLHVNGRRQVIDVAIFEVPLMEPLIKEINVVPVCEDYSLVTKTGTATGNTKGVIVYFNYSENISCQNCAGIFVVAAYDENDEGIQPSKKFADFGDSGALVYSTLPNGQKVGIGLVHKVMENYDLEGFKFDHVTLCVHLDNQIQAIQKLWKIHLHLFDRENEAVLFSVSNN